MSIYYMGSVPELPQEARAEVEQYLRLGVPNFEATGSMPECHCVTLGTVQEGKTHLTVISLLPLPSLQSLYMQVNRQSQKVKNLLACDKAEIAITNGTGYVILDCTTEVVTDEQLKTEKWEDWMTQYHPQGSSSPHYVLLRFVPQSIRAMI